MYVRGCEKVMFRRDHEQRINEAQQYHDENEQMNMTIVRFEMRLSRRYAIILTDAIKISTGKP